MQVPRNFLNGSFYHGHLTVQIAEFGVLGDLPTEEQPDEWFQYLKMGYKIKNPPAEFGGRHQWSYRRCFGKEQGYLHLTRVGFLANREAVINAWATQRQAHWGSCSDEDKAMFERYAMWFFDQTDAATERYRQRKLATLQ